MKEQHLIRRIDMYEIVFIIMCIIVNTFLNNWGLEIQVVPLLIIYLYAKISVPNEMDIKVNKRFIYGFILVFTLYMSIIVFQRYSDVFTEVSGYNIFGLKQFSVLIVQLPVVITMFAAYLVGVRAKDFNWKLTVSGVVMIIIVWFFIEMGAIIDSIKGLGLGNFIKSIVLMVPFKIYYPAIIEEVIFRGLCFSALLTLKMDKKKANIMQAILFGLIHVINYNPITIMSVFFIMKQVFIGFLLGKIYIKTKSLTPCIILHALINSI